MPTTIAPVAAPAPAPSPVRGVVAEPSPADYYRRVDGLSGPQLAKGLTQLLDATHRPVGYNRARDIMFAEQYRAPGSSAVTDLYSGAELVGVESRESANAHQVNTEHLWPQSQGAVGALRSDLHHLAPTLESINQYRWHLPFGAVTDAQDGAAPYRIADGAGSVGFDAAGRLVFEPRDAVKGVIARSLMYAHLHYGMGEHHEKAYAPRNFTDSLPTLLAWHAAYLPSPAELHRNDQNQARQGSRNPLVDHPEWASQLLAGQATTPEPRPRAQQLEEWVSFLEDPAGHGRERGSEGSGRPALLPAAPIAA